MSQRNKQTPTSWDALERGRTSSFGSLNSIAEGEQQHEYSGSPSETYATRVPQETQSQGNTNLRRRRSSIAMRINSIRQMGGPNSIDNFARSWQRAAMFHEITPVRRGSISSRAPDDEEGIPAPESQTSSQSKSLLSQQMQRAEPQSRENVREQHALLDPHNPTPTESTALLSAHSQPSMSSRSRLGSEGLGASYGSISSRLSVSAQRRASVLIQQQVEASMRMRDQPEEDKDDFMDRPTETEVRTDGEVIERVVGESTVPMTIFNSINVLVGVGILALPLGIRYAGWVAGVILLTFAALVTAYTARILAKCLDTNTASTTYGDIAYLAFDNLGRSLVEILFILELIAANVALIILFADSMDTLIPSVSVLYWKFVIALGLMPLNFVPLRYLSITSILGICCVIGLVIIVFVDGILKPHAPGSLRDVAVTYAFPADIRTIPLSLGLVMAPWGGHSVFPAVYKDMRHPKKYAKSLGVTYLVSYGLDLTMAVLGYLMFGEKVRDEVTSNILQSKFYPRVLSITTVALIAIIPITKMPLTNRPIMDTINKKFLIDLRQMDAKARAYSEKSLAHRSARAAIAIVSVLVQLGVAIAIPDFDSIMALMGSALCFTICVILPLSFYLKIFWGSDTIKLPERILCLCLIILSIALAILGTVFAILPKDRIGAESCGGRIGCF